MLSGRSREARLAISKISSGLGEGRMWIQRGEIIDAAMGELVGKEAFLEMLRWRSGSFEILPSDVPRPPARRGPP